MKAERERGVSSSPSYQIREGVFAHAAKTTGNDPPDGVLSGPMSPSRFLCQTIKRVT